MHPHWQATDDEQVVAVSVDSLSGPGNGEARPMVVRTASRKPAAIVGILVVLGMGYAAIGGTLSLPGQVATTDASVSVHLTAKGADPASLTITPGTTVEWVNDDTIPHVLSFGKLTVNGKALETPPIFPGSTSTMLVPESVKAGTYSYNSKTSTLSGKIVIQEVVADISSSESFVRKSSEASSASSIALPVTDEEMPAPTDEEGATPSRAQIVLPVNFHTVNSPNQGPVEPLHSGAPLAQITQHKPTKTAESGPAVWVLIAFTTIAVLFTTRKAFR